MSNTVDARGLSCPQPVLMAMDEMKRVKAGKIEIIVDTDSSKENVSRAAESQGWGVKDVQGEGKGYRVIIAKE